MQQIAFSFDRVTMVNIIKGFFHSLMVATLLLIVDTLFKMSGLVHFDNQFVASIFSMACMNGYNIGKEYISGM